jgi:hypothetical protein
VLFSRTSKGKFCDRETNRSRNFYEFTHFETLVNKTEKDGHVPFPNVDWAVRYEGESVNRT